VISENKQMIYHLKKKKKKKKKKKMLILPAKAYGRINIGKS